MINCHRKCGIAQQLFAIFLLNSLDLTFEN